MIEPFGRRPPHAFRIDVAEVVEQLHLPVGLDPLGLDLPLEVAELAAAAGAPDREDECHTECVVDCR